MVINTSTLLYLACCMQIEVGVLKLIRKGTGGLGLREDSVELELITVALSRMCLGAFLSPFGRRCGGLPVRNQERTPLSSCCSASSPLKTVPSTAIIFASSNMAQSTSLRAWCILKAQGDLPLPRPVVSSAVLHSQPQKDILFLRFQWQRGKKSQPPVWKNSHRICPFFIWRTLQPPSLACHFHARACADGRCPRGVEGGWLGGEEPGSPSEPLRLLL